MDPKNLPPPDADVWVTAPGGGIVRVGRASACDWLDGDPDDEELEQTSPHVVEALGFDPKDPEPDEEPSTGPTA